MVLEMAPAARTPPISMPSERARALGYVEGKNSSSTTVRSTAALSFPQRAAELCLNVDLIVTRGRRR
jgi:hypothetical protein